MERRPGYSPGNAMDADGAQPVCLANLSPAVVVFQLIGMMTALEKKVRDVQDFEFKC